MGQTPVVPAPVAYGHDVTGSACERVVLADGRQGRDPHDEPTRRALVLFGVATALALCVLGLAAALLADRAARRQGVSDARHITEVVAHTVIEPQLTPELLAGDPDELARLDRLVREHVLGPTEILRVKLWTASGEILYSDEPRLMGLSYPLGDDEREVLVEGGVEAERSRLLAPENRFERELAPELLETYLDVRGPDGEPLLFEAYYSTDVVATTRRELLTSFASISLIGLLVFAVVQLCLGWTGLRWIRRERERVVQGAAEESHRERLRVASDLHDGVLQDLVGASYVVSGAVAPVRGLGGADVAEGLTSAASGIRTGVQSLRSMIVDIYPESLRGAGLPAALSDLVAPLRARGTDVQVVVPDELALGPELEQAVYRAAQEAVRNVDRHARAHHVSIEVTATDAEVVLVVRDDGVGFAPHDRPAAVGHVGLRALADRTAARGGLLELRTAPGVGTELRMVLPS